MSNHLSKSLFSIPRLKKSRSRQQNQPENPTSLCLNALTADDAFLRFAAALGESFFSSRNPERNFIIFLCIPLPPRLFHPRKAPKRILFLTLHSPSAATFFTLEKPQREFYYFSLHSPSAAPFFSSRNPKRNSIIFLCIPSLPRPFFSPRSPERNFIFSLYIHSPPPRPEAPALHYNIFGLIGRLSPRGAQGFPTCRIHPTIVPEMRCAAPKRRNFPARKRYGRHTSGRRDGHTR